MKLIDSFIKSTLPHYEWTHEAHLRVGLYFVMNYNLHEAHIRFRNGIIRLNYFHGVENTATKGYHETLTFFWLKVLLLEWEKLETDSMTTEDQEKLIDLIVSKMSANRDLPLEYYKRERLISVKARASFLEPDLKPLEVSITEKLTV